VARHPRTAQSPEDTAPKRHQRDSASNRRGVRGAVLFLTGAGVATFVATLIGNSGETPPRAVAPAASVIPTAASPRGDLPDRIGYVLSLADADIAASDIARLNLTCAQGLPGAETLNVEQKLAELDRWAKHVEFETERNLHRFRENPGEYENSEAYFRALMLIVALQGDLGVHYNPERISEPDFTNSKNLFLHGMVADSNGGTCVSMPVLYVAIGRRLGYPMRLALTKGHVFARWDGAEHVNPAFRGRFNVEGTNRGLSTFDDAHYAEWPNRLTDAERANDWFLRSLSPAEELAVFLMQRGHCLEDTGRAAEAQVAYAMAYQLAPKSPEALDYLVNVVRGNAIARASSDPQALAAKAQRDSSAQWAAEKRRQAEEIARQAVERGRFQPATNPAPPRPPLGGSAAPQIPGVPK
jgi:tetratricopeptide (TPR) repeat protein